MLEAHGAGVERLDAHVVEDRPQRVQPRLQHGLEAAVHPDDRPLVVLQVDDLRLVAQRARLARSRPGPCGPATASRTDTTSTWTLQSGSQTQWRPGRSTPSNSRSRNSRPRSCSRTLKRRTAPTMVHLLSRSTTPHGRWPRGGRPAATPRAWSALAVRRPSAVVRHRHRIGTGRVRALQDAFARCRPRPVGRRDRPADTTSAPETVRHYATTSWRRIRTCDRRVTELGALPAELLRYGPSVSRRTSGCPRHLPSLEPVRGTTPRRSRSEARRRRRPGSHRAPRGPNSVRAKTKMAFEEHPRRPSTL